MQKPVKIVFCYARKDEDLLRGLQIQLGGLRRQGIVDIWHDRDISPGIEWQQAIAQQLDNAQIILLLVSPDFISSDYCYSIEMQQALEKHRRGETHVIPVILRPVHWKNAPFSDLQVLPEDAKPISGWSSLDDALFNVAEGVRKIVEALNTETSVLLSPSKLTPFSESREKSDIPNSKLVGLTGQDAQTILQSGTLVTFLTFFKSHLSRRSILSVVFVLLCLALIIGTNIAWFSVFQQDQLDASLVATSAANAYWVAAAKEVQFGFNAAHTHWNRYEHLINATNVNRLTPLWSYQTGGGILTSPAVANGMIYISSFDRKIYAFDATCQSACQPLWHYKTGGDIASSPAVANGMVYVGSDDGNFYAFDATCQSACQPFWRFQTGAKIRSSPTVANGMVYVGSQNGNLYAFDAACRTTCKPLWVYRTGHFIDSSPAVANGMIYVSSFDGKLYAFDATCHSMCQPLWSYQTDAPIVSSPAIANGMVYVGSENHMFYAFDATCRTTCQPLWFYPANNAVGSSPAIADKMVYVGSDDGNLYAFDTTCRITCKPLWSYQTGGVVASPMVANGVVYAGSRNGNLYAFDATCRTTCTPLWFYHTDRAIVGSPTIANGIVYIGSYDNNLYALGFSV